MAVASLVLGIVSMLAWLYPLAGLPISAVGLGLGIAGRQSSGRGLAIGGIATSAVGLGLSLVNGLLALVLTVRAT